MDVSRRHLHTLTGWLINMEPAFRVRISRIRALGHADSGECMKRAVYRWSVLP